jgi:sulfotransferase family protein
MRLPNFLIVGSAKCGTSSLYAYLQQHPQVFMTTPKEPTFFGNEGTDGLFNGPHDEDRAYHSRVITTWKDYTALFDRATTERALGEASIYYMYLPKAPEQIEKYIPKATMFAVLRNPADRAYSAYLHVVRQARERRSFVDSLRQEPMRIQKKWNPLWHFKAMGFYYEQVKRYFDRFGRDQVHIYLYEDLQKQPLPLIKQVFELIGVDSSFVPDTSKRYKKSYVPKNPTIEKILHKTKVQVDFTKKYWPKPLRWRSQSVKNFIDRVAAPNRVAPPRIPQDIRASLLEEYRDDILRLSDLLRRDLTHWCNPVSVGIASGE